MGQAWCKEKTSKAQDSKSPLDRVFVRCAHRIYPGLKEEGSVLGGATQRVTSSEIGYAGSPPRELLTRGRSIDSVDRPFHPSDWVDVNLEVPNTPRPSSALTNLTVDTNLYPTTTPTSSCSNLKDVTPIPPPRRRKRNKGRPLPPKPDEIVTENPSNGLKRRETGEEPLYSSVRSPKSSGDEQEVEENVETKKEKSREDGIRDGKRTKEIYEHKVNGTGRIISSDVVSGKRTIESNQYQRKLHENEEYEKFARTRTKKDSSTPKREEKCRPREFEKQTRNSSRNTEKSSNNARTKNYSTVSLPNYDELDVSRHRLQENEDDEHQENRTRKSRRPVRSSTGSLPAESFLSPFSEKTSVRLEDYILTSDNLTQVLEKLDCGVNGVVEVDFVKFDPSKSEDWVLGDIGNCELNHQHRLSFEDISRISEGRHVHDKKDEDVVDYSKRQEEETRSSLERDISKSPIHLQKPESFGKTPSPVPVEPEYSEVDPNRSHKRYFEPPTLDKSCRISCVRESSKQDEPFFLDEAKHRSAFDTIEGGSRSVDLDSTRTAQSRMMFTRSLSNESEPNEDAYEAKELENGSAGLIRTISEESFPREMLDEEEIEEFCDEKLAKDVQNKLKKSMDDWKTNTPPPSPEPRIKRELQDSDHSTLLKVLKDEAAEGSNFSSMTPSLTELEAALSDMLEKDESQDGSKEEGKLTERNEIADKVIKRMETEIVKDSGNSRIGEAEDHRNLVDEEVKMKEEASAASLKQILEDKKPVAIRKVSFCTWEETVGEMETQKGEGMSENLTETNEKNVSHKKEEEMENVVLSEEIPPAKPSRWNRSMDDLVENKNEVPTPPKRRNRSVGAIVSNKKDSEKSQNGSIATEPISNDRLI